MNEGLTKPWLRLPKTDPEILGVILGIVYGLIANVDTRGFPDENASPLQFFEDLYPEHPLWVGTLAVGIAVLSGLFSYFLFLIFAPSFRPQMRDRRKPIFFRKMRVFFRCSIMFFSLVLPWGGSGARWDRVVGNARRLFGSFLPPDAVRHGSFPGLRNRRPQGYGLRYG